MCAVKTCFRCGRVRTIEEFYRHSEMADGHLGKCKECTRRDVADHYRRNRERIRVYEQARYQDPERRRKVLEYQRRRRKLRPERELAHRMVSNAVRDGRLKREPCEDCGATERVQAHHDDYSKPLSVRWLCFRCHREHAHHQVVSIEVTK